MSPKLIASLIAATWIAAVVAALWWYLTPPPAQVGQWTTATTAPQIKNVPDATITPAKVIVKAPIAKKKLKLPPEIQDDPNKHVLDAVRIKKDTHPVTVTTVIDEATGEVKTIVRREPLPWLALEQTGELRLDYGWKGGQQVMRLSLREDLLQVKALHAGVNLTLDSDGDYFVGAGVGWQW